MKKKIIATLLTVATILSLTACGTFTCDLCGEEKTGKSYTESIEGVKITYCKDCHDQLEEFINLFN